MQTNSYIEANFFHFLHKPVFFWILACFYDIPVDFLSLTC